MCLGKECGVKSMTAVLSSHMMCLLPVYFSVWYVCIAWKCSRHLGQPSALFGALDEYSL